MSAVNFFRLQYLQRNLQRKVDDPLTPGVLYVIRDLPKNKIDAVEGALKKGTELSSVPQILALGLPENFFTEVRCLNIISMTSLLLDSSNNNKPVDVSECVLQLNEHGDLQKLHNLAIAAAGGIFITVRENWDFEAVRKLPWKLHNQGLNPFFIDANRNTHWQKEWKVLKRFSDKGVTMPIDLMAVARWQKSESNWLKSMFGKQVKNSLEQISAVYLMEIQMSPPYYIYESDIAQWKQGVLLFQ